MASEFDLIARFFSRPVPSALLGVGDDAALLRISPGMELVVSTDMLVSGRHFFSDADPLRLGHKALAVNLSDLAAMGAQPRWALLSLALPDADETWLAGFAKGFFALAERYGVDLVGGDTTRGSLNISVTILGEVAAGRALRRDRAQPGDDVWVSGLLGCAALGLKHMQGECRLPAAFLANCLNRLHAPEPRVALGRALSGCAHAAIDVSDGLLSDLGHILERSGVGAVLEASCLPLETVTDISADLAMHCALSGGDDYELCFTAPSHHRGPVLAAASHTGTPVTRIGHVRAGTGLELIGLDGQIRTMELRGYDHFAN